jgi:S1-C subfamily serine protease
MSEPQQGHQPAAPYAPHERGPQTTAAQPGAAPSDTSQPVVPHQFAPQPSAQQSAVAQQSPPLSGGQQSGVPQQFAPQSAGQQSGVPQQFAPHSVGQQQPVEPQYAPQTPATQTAVQQQFAPQIPGQQTTTQQSAVPQQTAVPQQFAPQAVGQQTAALPAVPQFAQQSAAPQQFEQRLPVPLPPAMQPPLMPAPPVAPRRRRSVVTTLLLILLVLAVGGQTYWIYRLSGQLTDAKTDAARDRQAVGQSVEAVASRVAELEKAAFHPDQIAKSALPSVFRVKADRFSGTAWAVGKPAASGGTNLFTNYHVVEAVWEKGGDRRVSIEHNEKLYYAKIVGVDKEKDVAHLETSEKFPGLAVARGSVTPGQPIVVVGAPLGLESSVTTGVVSAFRKLEGETDPYVQFDAPINPGNSGGPVINAQGEVVGIASAKVRNAEGIGLAIPIDLACKLFPICG